MKGRVEYSNVDHPARQVLMRNFTQRRKDRKDAKAGQRLGRDRNI